MKQSLTILGLTFSALALAKGPVGPNGEKVIYGEDNRHEVTGYHDGNVITAAKSTVALIKATSLTAGSDGSLSIPSTTFGEKTQLCSTERFLEQPAAAFCSGFLVAPNKIMTAGHCVKTVEDCAGLRLVFDYRLGDDGVAPLSYATDKVYTCKRVLGWKKEDEGADFAVVELDRAVTDREPLKLSNNRKLKVQTGVLVIGHPSGLPTKITDAANVRKILKDKGFFMANLDTYGGNSGSAVLNQGTLEVEGILVRGEKDFEVNYDQMCRYSYHVDERGGRGEDVTLISAVSENGAPAVESAAGLGFRYVWLDSDQTCNLFMGAQYLREVDNALCGH